MKEDEKGKGQEKIRDLASAYRKKKGKAIILPNPLLVPREPVEEKPVKQEEPTMEVAKDKKPFRAVMQDAIESWKDIKKESHRPVQFEEGPRKKSLEELFAEMQKAREDRKRLIAETAPETIAFKARGGGGRTFLVSPDTTREDRWRMTHFDDKGPVGHTENMSFPQAMETAHEYGANLKDRLPPDAFAEGGSVQPITGVTFDDSAEAKERYKQKLAMWAKQYEESLKPQTVFPKAYDPEGTARPEEKRGKHLVHYSQSGKVFSKLDPKFFGEGKAGQERERGNIIPRTYYYEAESSPEAVVRSGAKHRYVIPRPDRILDLASDEGAHWVRRAGGDISELEQMLKDHGFAGYKNSAHPELPHAVALFHEQEPIHITPKFAEGGRVMMQAGGNPGMAIDIGESPLFQQDLAGEEIPLPTPVPTATPQPTQFQPEVGKIDIAESPLFQEHLKEAQMAPEGDLSARGPSVGTTPAEREKTPATTFTREYAPVWDMSGPEPTLTTIPHEQVMPGILEGRYSFDKGAMVPMKFADGEVIPVPAAKVEDAIAHQMTYATPKDVANFKYGDQTGIAFAEGLARGLFSAPVTTAVEKALGVDPEGILARQDLGAATAGEVLGFTAPLLLTGGAWTAAKAGLTGTASALRGAAAISAMAPFPGLSSLAGRAAAKTVTGMTTALPALVSYTAAEVGRGALEMALYDAQHHLSNYMLDAPPSDSILASVGMSAFLGGAISGGLGLAGYGLGKFFEKRPLGAADIFHYGRPSGEPPTAPPPGGPPPPPGGAPGGRTVYLSEPGQPPIKVRVPEGEGPLFETGAPSMTSPQVTPEMAERMGIPWPRRIRASEAPEGAGPLTPELQLSPEGPAQTEFAFPEPKVEASPDEVLTVGSPGEPIKEPEGLFSEKAHPEVAIGGWIPPELAEEIMNGNSVAWAKVFPDEVLPEVFGVDVRNMNPKERQNFLQKAFARFVGKERPDANLTRESIERITNGAVTGDQVPFRFISDNGTLHRLEQKATDTFAGLGAPQKKIQDTIDAARAEAILKLLGSRNLANKSPVEMGRIMQEAINSPLAEAAALFKHRYAPVDRMFESIVMTDAERAGLLKEIDDAIASVGALDKAKKIGLQELRNQLGINPITKVPFVSSMLQVRKSLKELGTLAYDTASSIGEKSSFKVQGYEEAWKILKNFENRVAEGLSLTDPRIPTQEARDLFARDWKAKLAADREYEKVLENAKFLARILGAKEGQLVGIPATRRFLQGVSPDVVYDKISLKNLDYNKLLKLRKDFRELAEVVRSAEKVKILLSADPVKNVSEISVYGKKLAKLSKEEKAFIFRDEAEKQLLEDILQINKQGMYGNFSNTSLSNDISFALNNPMAMLGGMTGMAGMAAQEATKGSLINMILQTARKSMPAADESSLRYLQARRDRLRYKAPPTPPKNPKKYAEGGMVSGDAPAAEYNPQQAFVSAVNQPPYKQEAHRIVNAIVKSDKMITNSVKSVFDPKSTYKIAQPNPKGVERLKGYINQIHENPGSIMSLGSEITPEFNSGYSRAVSSAANLIKSFEPPAPKDLPFDTSVKAPPSVHSDIYNHVLRVAEQPLSVLHKVKNGTVIPEEVQAVQTIYPDLYQRLQNQITEHLVEAKANKATIPYRTKIGLSAFLGSPLDTTMTPEAIQSAQPMQQNQPPQGAQTGAQPKRSTSALDKMATMAQTPGQARMGEKSKGK